MWTISYRDTWTNAAGTEFETVHLEEVGTGEPIVVETQFTGEPLSNAQIAALAATQQGVKLSADDIDG